MGARNAFTGVTISCRFLTISIKDPQALYITQSRYALASRDPGISSQTLLDSIIERLQRAHRCTVKGSRGSDLSTLIKENTSFKLDKVRSTIKNAGNGLFLTDGKIHQHEVVTLFPGLIYQVPYGKYISTKQVIDSISDTSSNSTKSNSIPSEIKKHKLTQTQTLPFLFHFD